MPRPVLDRLRRLGALVYLVPLAYVLQPLFWTPLGYHFYDYFTGKRPVAPWMQVLVVGIDRVTREAALPQPVFPISRHVEQHAELTQILATAGARAIVFDLTFEEGAFVAPPALLAEAFRTAGNVYLSMWLSERRIETQAGMEVLLVPELPESTLLAASRGAYLAQMTHDPDGTLRYMRPERRIGRMGLVSIPEQLSGFQVRDATPILFPSSEQPIPTVSYRDVLGREPKTLGMVAGRTVFVGLVEDPLIDAVNVPREQLLGDDRVDTILPGVVTLAAATETLMRGAPLRNATRAGALAWNLGWCALVLLIPPSRRPRLAVLIVGIIGLVAMSVTGVVHIHLDRIFPAGLLFGCIFICGLHLIIGTHLETTKALHAEEVENERVHRELSLARSTQEQFLPKQLPKVEGMEFWGRNLSSLEVSGDYYDVIDVGDQARVVLAIADVSGKGLPAALLMSNVQAGLHMCVYSGGGDLESTATKLNRLLYENSSEIQFVTLFFGEIDKQTHALRYVRAGHDVPFIISRDGSVEDLKEGGMVLGILPDVSYSMSEVQLPEGAVLCLYTDGISEASRDEEEYGRERLVEVVRQHRDRTAAEIGEAIIASVEAFSGQAGRADDMTLVVVHL